MITKLGKNKPYDRDNSIFNTGLLDLALARLNFEKAIDGILPLTAFTNFINFIYANTLQNKLNFWLSSEYAEGIFPEGLPPEEGVLLLDVEKIYFYSKNKQYSGNYLICPSNLTKAQLYDNSEEPSDPYVYLQFLDTESLYYHPLVDKSLPLGNSNKHIFIVMSPYNTSYEFSTKENDWIFSYGLEWITSLQPSSEGLCFTLEGDTASGKKLSYSTGGNNNLLTSTNTGIESLGVFSIKYDTINKNISTKFNGLSDTVTGLNYDVTLYNSNDIKSGNGFFLNSHIISNSIAETTEAYNRMKNWKFYEMIIFEDTLTTSEELLMNTYLKTKYGL